MATSPSSVSFCELQVKKWAETLGLNDTCREKEVNERVCGGKDAERGFRSETWRQLLVTSGR